MTQVNLGRIGFVVKDYWDAATQYKKLDVVRYQNASYAAVVDAPTLGTPPTLPQWKILAADGGILTPIKMNFFGTLTPTIGKARYYPERDIVINKIYAAIGSASTGVVSAQIKKNGTTIATVSISAGNYKSEILEDLSITVTQSDYLTADITTAQDGNNLIITLGYS